MPAPRIISLLPTATEIVLALGAGDCLAGVSHDHHLMPHVARLPVVNSLSYDDSRLSAAEIDALVSATYARGESIYILDAERLQALRPTLILTQELCDVCALTPTDLQRCLARLDPQPQILSLHAQTVAAALDDMLRVARALDREAAGLALVAQLRSRIEAVAARTRHLDRRPEVFCLEWPRPLYNAGHWTPELVELAGGRDRLAAPGAYSTRRPWEELQAYDPEMILGMVCGFSVERAAREMQCLRQYPGWDNLRAVRNRQVWVLDGPRYFSQAGPGIVEGLELLARIFHPTLFGPPPALRAFAELSSAHELV